MAAITVVAIVAALATFLTERAQTAEARARAASLSAQLTAVSAEGELQKEQAQDAVENAAAQATSEQGVVRPYTLDESSLAVADAAASATAVSVQTDATLAAFNATAQVDAPEPTATAAALAVMEANAAATVAASEPTPAPLSTVTVADPPAEEAESPDATPLPGGISRRPDRIAFVSDLANRGDSLFLMDVSNGQRTTDPRQITETDGYDWWPSWCGEATILFERGDDPWNTQRMEILQVRLYGDGSAAVTEPTIAQMPANSVMNGAPSCAMQASRLAFSSRARGAASNEFGIYTTLRGRPTRLGRDGFALGGHVSWSPDATEIVFMHYSRADSRFHIYHVNLDRPDQFSDLTAAMDASCKYPVWSPAGDQIAFACSTGSGESRDWALHLLSLRDGAASESARIANLHTGSELDEARQSVRHAITPSWSPDGQWIAFSSDRDGDWDIYLYELASGEQSNITGDLESDELHPRWAP